MEIVSVLLAFCAENSPITGEFAAQRPVTRSLQVFFDLSPNQQLSKQRRRWWFEMPSHSLWRHCNDDEWKRVPALGAATIYIKPHGCTLIYTWMYCVSIMTLTKMKLIKTYLSISFVCNISSLAFICITKSILVSQRSIMHSAVWYLMMFYSLAWEYRVAGNAICEIT